MKIGERGQITIPKRLREKYGLFPNIEVEIKSDKKGIIIQKKSVKSGPVEKIYGILNKNESTDPYIEEIRGR